MPETEIFLQISDNVFNSNSLETKQCLKFISVWISYIQCTLKSGINVKINYKNTSLFILTQLIFIFLENQGITIPLGVKPFSWAKSSNQQWHDYIINGVRQHRNQLFGEHKLLKRYVHCESPIINQNNFFNNF